MRKFILGVIVILIATDVLGQKISERREQVWLGYFSQMRFTDRSGLWVDIQLRHNDYLSQKSLSINRLGYTYYCSDQLRLTAGYGHITHFSLTPEFPNVPEHRPWQQVQWFDQKRKASLSQYFRVEERFVRQVANGELTDDYRFTWRFRYAFAVAIPLKGDAVTAGTPFVFLNNEAHVSAGKNVVNNYFDQNRLFAGLGYQFTSNLNAHFGYLYVFQQLPAGNQYIHINALRLFVFHNFDFRKR